MLLCTATSLFAQEKKYPSLLWEISGNGIEKPSYLYGSMHVSDKVSYHLSDAFFTHLLNADMVAGESDPATWSELTGMMSEQRSQYTGGFYSGFYFKPLDKKGLGKLFRSNNYSLNYLLSRTDESQQEGQEDTYLDMFIYRTGRKYNKVPIGLENARTSVLGILKIDPSSVKPIEANRAALQKVLKNMSYQEAMTHFYREKDLDMLDSINVLTVPEFYLKALLYDRNEVMVHSIDSLVHKGSLFAAVGAAHLPGKWGIIQALRKKGYTVTPVFDTYGEKGLQKKQQIDAYFIKPAYKQYTSRDGMISLPLFNEVIESRAMAESPDLANGGYVTVKRTLLADFLKKDDRLFDHRSLDSLFYENIQGKILEKKFYMQGSYQVYDVKSTTRIGNAQHYRYYITPLEIIAVIMSGEGNYVRQFENDIFNNITIKAPTGKWQKVSPARGGFSVLMPESHTTYGDTKNFAPEDVQMLGYDKGGYYFVAEKTVDTPELEDTRFELQRMHYEFYANFDADSTKTSFGSNPLSFQSASKAGSRDVRLKSVIHGAKYYLLGAVGATDTDTEKFFSSFAFAPERSDNNFRTYTDTIGQFRVQVPKKENERLDFVFNYRNDLGIDDEKVNQFNIKSGAVAFVLPSGKKVNLGYNEAHRYEPLKPADSVYASIKKATLEEEDYSYYNDDDAATPLAGRKGITTSQWPVLIMKKLSKKGKTHITGEKASHNTEKGYYQWDFIVEKDNSEQATKQRHYYRNGMTYNIGVLIEKGYKNNDPAIEKIFDSFEFTGETVSDENYDRFARFMEDANSEHDSIRRSAIQSVYNLELTEKDLPAVMRFIDEFKFTAEETYARQSLYNMVGVIHQPNVIPFLEKEYKREGVTASDQFMVLGALASQRSKEGYKKILELMEYDLPLSDSQYDVTGLFYRLRADTENAAVLMPDVLQFYSIPEYHEPIVDFAATLLSEEAIKPGKIKAYKKMILTSAKLELKRSKSRKPEAEIVSDYIDYDGGDKYEGGDLIEYLDLLYPFRNDKDVKPFFKAVRELDTEQETLELARLDIVNNNIDEKTITPLLADPETLFSVYNMGEMSQKESLVKKTGEQDIATSAVYVLNSLAADKKSLAFIKRMTVPYEGYMASFFFFRVTNKDPKDEEAGPDNLAAVAFLQNTDGSINTHAYRMIPIREIIDEDEMQRYMKNIIDETINEYNNRTQTGSQGLDPLLYTDYMEYGE